MSEISTAKAARQRADARQNAAAILDAAAEALGVRPEAGLAEIARRAGISRQTLYAHFPSRDALVNALIERATGRVLAALEAANLEHGPADEALVRFLEVGWRSFETDPFLLHLAAPPVPPEQDRERHAPVFEHLHRVVSRGQREGTIDPGMARDWILAAVLALGHAAGEEVRAGRMSSAEAVNTLRRDIPRLLHPE
ncbi:MAG: TetR/AcrR family transcriptional regulator [Actinocrinis sp.]